MGGAPASSIQGLSYVHTLLLPLTSASAVNRGVRHELYSQRILRPSPPQVMDFPREGGTVINVPDGMFLKSKRTAGVEETM